MPPPGGRRPRCLTCTAARYADHVACSRAHLCPRRTPARRRGGACLSQGPLPNTTGDFWRMVAQTRAAAIVMLTGYVEGYSEKCAEYLPRRPGQEQTYAGGVRVRCVAVQSMALEGGEDASDTAEPAGPAVATEVQLEVRLPADGAGGEPHRVSQFHFLEWHDHNVPEERHLPIPLGARRHCRRGLLRWLQSRRGLMTSVGGRCTAPWLLPLPRSTLNHYA